MGSRGGILDFLEGVALVGSFVPNPIVKMLSMGIGMVVSSLPVKSSQPPYTGETYSWSQAPNKTVANGTPMPVIYGKTRVKPTLKNRYIAMEGSKQYLYALYSFACHAIDERVVAEWALGTRYAFGDEVTFSAEPGKTYTCVNAHTASGTHPLFHAVTGELMPYWVEGKGTAAITDIQVNREDISGLSQYGVAYWTRPGLAVQSVIPAMSQTFANNAHSDNVNAAYPTPMHVFRGDQTKTFYTSGGSRIWYAHRIYYDGVSYWVSGGNFGVGTTTRYFYWTVPANPEDQTSYTITTTSKSTLAQGEFYVGYWVDYPAAMVFKWTTHTPEEGDWHTYDIATTTTQNIQVELTLPNGLIGTTVDGKFPTPALGKVFIQYRVNNGNGTFGAWQGGIDTVRHNNGHPFDAVVDYGGGLVEGTLIRDTPDAISIVLQVRDREYPLTEGMYQVRVATFIAATVTLTNIAAITYGDFTYPGEPLLALKVLATNKFNGDIEVTAVCERSLVWVYDGAVWLQKSASNPAWAVWDMLVQGNQYHPATNNVYDPPRQQATYGCGLHPDRIDYTSFYLWALYAGNTLGYSLNTVYDDFTTLWDAIQRVCTEFRGMVFPIGTRYYAIRDKSETPAQLFSMGNIVEGTFHMTWPDRSKRAGSVELTYFDEDNNYDQVTFLIRGTDWETQEALRLTLYGTTNYTQAYKKGRYFLKCNELLTQMVELEVGAGEMQVGVGDVVYVQHDAPKWWGDGGRVTDYVEAAQPPLDYVVVLDKTITLVQGTTYYIYLKHLATDTIESHQITGYGAMDRIAITNSYTQWAYPPAAGDVWAVAPVGVLPTFRVIDVGRTNDLTKRLTLLEYTPNVYETIFIAPKVSVNNNPVFNIATGVRATEILSRRTTGEYQSNIAVAWEAGQGATYGEWDVLYRDVDAGDIGWVGVWAAGQTYNQFDKVLYNGDAYISLVDNNTETPGG